MSDERDEVRLTPEEQRLVETLRTELDPGPRSPGQRSAFVRALEERLIRGERSSWQPLVLAASAVMAAVALWLALPVDRPGEPDTRLASARRPSLLAYAYYETDYLDDASDAYLSAEYEAIAAAFDVP